MKKFFKNIILSLYFILLLLLLVLTLLTLIYNQLANRSDTLNKLNKYRYHNEEIIANRGSIISYDNHKLAFDVDKYNIIIDPMNIKADTRKKISDEEVFEGVIDSISNALNIDKEILADEVKEKIKNNKRYFDLKILVNSDIKDNLINEVKKYTRNKIIFYSKYPERYFTSERDFKNLIGFFNSENKALYGIESKYDDILRGQNGIKRYFMPAADVESIKKSTTPYKVSEEILKESKRGNDLHLTIDSIMQFSLDDILKKTYEDHEAVSVMGILMESNTGKIIAMSSYPKPNDDTEVKNLNIVDIFEPGSIFKAITVSAALNEGIVNKNTIIHSDGEIKIKNVRKSIRDHDKSTVGDFTLAEMIAKSGNVAMVKIQQMMDRSVFYDYITKFGFGKKTGIDTNFEANYNLIPEDKFSEIRAANISFGQGIAMTQIQMINALNASINGGKLLKPYLVDYISDEKGNIIEINKPEIINRPISEKTSKIVRELLEGVVEYGTGRGVSIPGYKIGGKTGTAQKAIGGRYASGKYYSSFFTFFPTSKPEYSLLITVNEPKGVYYGAAVALPPAKEVLEKLIKYKGIKPDYIPEDVNNQNIKNTKKEEEKVKKVKIENTKLEKIKKDFDSNIMPDLIGLSLKDLIYINPFDKYKNIEYIGNGNIINQNIEAGEVIENTTKIILEFR